MTAAEKDRALAERIWNAFKGETIMPYRSEAVSWANTLRLAQLTLHRWAELECGTGGGNHTWSIERDEAGRPYLRHQRPGHNGRWVDTMQPTPDREAGALRRVEQVCKEAGLHFWHQTDPRGCALYVAAFPLDQSNYDQGVACL